MSLKRLSHNRDLKQLQDDGFILRLRHNETFLSLHVPYVNEAREVKWGVLTTGLALAGDNTVNPVEPHTVWFEGEHPCDAKGNKIDLANQVFDEPSEFAPGMFANFSFSRKPDGGYLDYYHKMTTYAAILASPARAIDPGIKPRPFAAATIEDPASPFVYPDTASGLKGLGVLNRLFANERVAIIGLGGTGGFILDLVAKTCVAEIRLFDGDVFANHNAFRAPGAAPIEELRELPMKVEYFKTVYSRMHRFIAANPVHMSADNLDLLDGITFAFLSMDEGEAQEAVVTKLEALGVPFINVGMGVDLDDGVLGGILRTTTSTPERRDVARRKLSFTKGEGQEIYDANIQTSDLNCLNAALAVFRWKRLRGFYRDLECELHSTFTLDGNIIINSEHAC